MNAITTDERGYSVPADPIKHKRLFDKMNSDIAEVFSASPSGEQSSYTQERPKNHVPIWIKQNLTLEEAAAYFGIGINKIREITNDKRCDSVLFVGTKRLIKREKFEIYLASSYSI